MCTVVAFHRVNPAIPFVVAANRDELYARRTTGAGLLLDAPRAVGGRDVEKGGTWMGVTEGGLFVGVTNQRTMAGPKPDRASRGSVVLRALATGSVAGVRAFVETLDARAYNPFNVMFGDARELFVAYAREDAARIEVEAALPGITVLTNDRLGSPHFSFKIARATELARPLVSLPWPDLARELPQLLSDHDTPPLDDVPPPPSTAAAWVTREILQKLQAICVHTPTYGTRSATIAAIGERAALHYLFVNARPHDAAFVEHTDLLS